MNEKLIKLKEDVAKLDLLSTLSVTEDELDDMLDSRDGPEFEADWMRVDEAVQQAEGGQELSADDKTIIDEIRETAFKKTYRVTGSVELAGYVSDDFDLIARAMRAGYRDDWLIMLWAEYQSGRFPYTKLMA